MKLNKPIEKYTTSFLKGYVRQAQESFLLTNKERVLWGKALKELEKRKIPLHEKYYYHPEIGEVYA